AHARPDAVAGRRAVAAHGAGGGRGELAAPQRAEDDGGDAPGRAAGRRARRGRRAVLPVARLAGRARALPLGDGAARPHLEPAAPSEHLRVLPQLEAWYRPFWETGVGVDVRHPGDDLEGYRLVLAPQLYLLTDDDAARLRRYVTDGGCLALGPFSAVADGNARVRTGPVPAPFTGLLGAEGEEWWPLPGGGGDDDTVGLVPDPASPEDVGSGTARTWAEVLRPTHGVVVARFDGGDVDGLPALVRSRDDRLHYLATIPDDVLLRRWLLGLAERRGVAPRHPVAAVPAGVEVARRGPVTFV